MHGLAVVPHHQVADPPLVGVDELPLGRVLDQVAQEAARLGHRPADDRAGVRGQIERLAPGTGMDAHQALAHRLEARALLVGEVGEAELLAREDLRVLADQVLDLGLGLVVERIVGRAHVGELGVAALRRDGCGRAAASTSPGSTLNELSECQSRLPMANSRRRSSRAKTWLFLSRFDTSAKVVGSRYSSGARRLAPIECSSSPRLRVKASCCSSSMGWSWKTSTAYVSMPAWIAATSSAESGLRHVDAFDLGGEARTDLTGDDGHVAGPPSRV